MGDLVKILPTVLGFLGGPAGGLAGAGLEWLAGKFGAKEATVDSIKATLAGFKPEDTIAMRKLDIEFQEFCIANNIKVDLAQIGVNVEEAKSTNWFVAGWRPAVGWICASALAYTAILEPFVRFVSTVIFKYAGSFPVIDTSLTTTVLLGMLGLGAMRTAEKIKDSEGNR